MTWNEQLEAATTTWQGFCRSLEATGTEALARTLTEDEIDLAEGLRHLTRMTRLVTLGAIENANSRHPYLWTALDPHQKMGGDNPQGLYLSGPINGSDTFRLRGTRGSARWISIIISQSGDSPFGDALFLPDLTVEDDTIDVVLAPEPHDGNWLRTDQHSKGILIRQFFGTPDDIVPMQLTLENVTSRAIAPEHLTLDAIINGVRTAAHMFSVMLPLMQGELLDKAGAKNSFKTDLGDPTSTSGGVPGGNAVTARWHLEPDEALIVRVTPPEPCAYWDVQVGNGWYESFDYRHRFSGLTCEGAHLNDDGSLVLVLSEQDPHTANWLETSGHREGHIAIRWQLTEELPIPETEVIPVADIAKAADLPPVSPEQRSRERADLASSFEARFCR